MNKWLSFILLSIFLVNLWIPLFNQAYAAQTEVFLPDLSYPSGEVINVNADNQNEFLSPKQYVTPNDVSTTSVTDPILRVELRDKTGAFVAEMNPTSSNMYHLNTPIKGREIEVESNVKLALSQGPFQWFRDPGDRSIWMYDYAEPPAAGQDPLAVTQVNRHYLKSTLSNQPQPPSGMCAYATKPIEQIGPLPTSYPGSRPCNEATTERSGYLDMASISDFKYGSSKRLIPTEKITGFFLKPEKFEFDSQGYNLSIENIKYNPVVTEINQSTFAYRFDYTILFTVPYDKQISNNTNGIVIEWYDSWQVPVYGKVYEHQKLVAVAITITNPGGGTYPDLTVKSLTGPSCIESNVSAHFKYTIENKYIAVSSGFKTSISVDGITIATHDFPTGIGITTIDGAFDYKFTANTMKSITVFVDSNDDINEGLNNNNNSKTVNFTSVNDCSGGGDPGPCTGDCTSALVVDLTIRFPVIEWKDMDIFEVTIKNPTASSCTPVEGRFAIEQGNKEYQFPYRPVTGIADDISFAWNGTKYPGDMEVGNVKVYYALHDSCGKTAYAGPKPFEIIKTAGAPTVSLAWYDSSTNAEVIEVVQGANVFLKPTVSDSRKEKVTILWNFNNGSSWVAGLPAAKGWTNPLNAAQYTNIIAAEKGSHKVCVTGTNESGVSATGCSTLYVIGPEPTAIIDVSGWLKEDRRIQLSGAKSSSPKGAALTYAWSIDPVMGQTLGTAADIIYIAPFTGKLKDMKVLKQGLYKVSLMVIDTEGLSDSTSTIIDVDPDLKPIGEVLGNEKGTRQPSDRGYATYTNVGNAASMDQDNIDKRLWSFTYDSNNDGLFNEPWTQEVEESDMVIGVEYMYMSGSEPLVITNLGGHIVTVKAQNVGKIAGKLRVIESYGQPSDLRY
ncbi:CARDB protein [Paenibacillus sp. 1_12]|uniref:CARDB domain-containing protein n=1 Tax=Paenibacillus sp. 1_12 TaxID=1566278 RepID=UPI0008EB0732|nr:CARDB domain-containing protein [Paenibacillus sp. 1_12]SFK71623.1 CARDB protein [Paenibacillus sp. 1_12]